jgi:hypothetical protein
VTFYALWGVVSFSLSIAFAVGLLTEEVGGEGRKPGIAFLVALALCLYVGLSVVL